jgi:hypothetical protein
MEAVTITVKMIDILVRNLADVDVLRHDARRLGAKF